MSTRKTMGLLLLVEVEPKTWCTERDLLVYQDMVTAELAFLVRCMDTDKGFPFRVASVKQAVAP